jgi:hypothetical protein
MNKSMNKSMNLNDIFSDADIKVITTNGDGSSKVTTLGDGLDGLISFFEGEVKKMEDKKKTSKEGQHKRKIVMDAVDDLKSKLPKQLSDKLDTMINKLQEEYNEKIDKEFVKNIISTYTNNEISDNLFKFKRVNNPTNNSEPLEIKMEMDEEVLSKMKQEKEQKEFLKSAGVLNNGEKETMGAIYYLVHHIFADPKNYHGGTIEQYTTTKFKSIQNLLNTKIGYSNNVWFDFDITHLPVEDSDTKIVYAYTQLDWKLRNDRGFINIDFKSDEFVRWVNNCYSADYYFDLFSKNKEEFLNSNINHLNKVLYTIEDYFDPTKDQKVKIKKNIRILEDERSEFYSELKRIENSVRG